MNLAPLQMDLFFGKKPQLYSTNVIHLEAIIESLVLFPSQIHGNICKILSHEHEEEKRINWKILLLILEGIRFHV